MEGFSYATALDLNMGYYTIRLDPEASEMEKYSHEGYLIKVVVMAVAGKVTRELSPILSWSNNNYDLKLGEKARRRELRVWEATSHDTFPFA